MKAATFYQVGMPLVIEDISAWLWGGHQVLIKVGGCGFRGIDVGMTLGKGMQFPLGVVWGVNSAAKSLIWVQMLRG